MNASCTTRPKSCMVVSGSTITPRPYCWMVTEKILACPQELRDSAGALLWRASQPWPRGRAAAGGFRVGDARFPNNAMTVAVCRVRTGSAYHDQIAPYDAPWHPEDGGRGCHAAARPYPLGRCRREAVDRVLGSLGATRQRDPAQADRRLGRKEQGGRFGRLHHLERVQAHPDRRRGGTVRHRT